MTLNTTTSKNELTRYIIKLADFRIYLIRVLTRITLEDFLRSSRHTHVIADVYISGGGGGEGKGIAK